MAVRKKRWFAKREETLRGTGYDSLFEKRMHETSLRDCLFHSKDHEVEYKVDHRYEPDFIYRKDNMVYLIECKGRFRDSSEARKYIFIREYLPENHELVFVLEKANTKFPFAKKRKDGTCRTQEEWLTDHQFRHWNQHTFDLEKLFSVDA